MCSSSPRRNDIGKLPPELSRAERFDGVWFLDLPSVQQRRAIWNIYLELFGLDPQQPAPVDADFTGAEIRACCRLAALLDVPLVEAAQERRARRQDRRRERRTAPPVGQRSLPQRRWHRAASTSATARRKSPKPGRKVRRADPSNN